MGQYIIERDPIVAGSYYVPSLDHNIQLRGGVAVVEAPFSLSEELSQTSTIS